MNEGQRLQFVEASAQAFVEALSGLPVSAVLVGDGLLAADISQKAAQANISLDWLPRMPSAVELEHIRVLILAELDVDLLGEQLQACLELNDIRVIAPVTARHFSRMPLFVVSIPKAGTHLAYELAQALGYAPGVEPPEFPKPQTWYCVEFSNSHTVARDFFVDTVRRSPFGNRHHPITQSPVLFAYRHPFDVLVSEAHYYHRDGKTAFAGYFDGEDFDDRVRRLIDDEWLLGSLRQRIGSFLPWLRFPNVVPVSFEELVGEAGGGSAAAQRRLIWSILLKLQVDGCVDEIASKVFNRNAATFREGKIGAWRTELPPELIDELTDRCGDILAVLGYSSSADTLLPSLSAKHAARPIRYSTVDFDRLPLLVEPDFMGCNLVRYLRRFFAVPLSANCVALDQLPENDLARLPDAATLSELKAVLLIGREAHDRRCAQLSDGGKALASGSETRSLGSDSNAPRLFEEYKGFNLIAWQGHYFALRQSVGTVDLSQDVQALVSRYGFGDILVARTPDDLMDDIDGVSTAMRLVARVEQQRDEFGAGLRQVNEAVIGFQKSLSDLGSRLDAMQSESELAVDNLFQRLALAIEDQARHNVELCRRLDEQEKNVISRLAGFLSKLFTRREQ